MDADGGGGKEAPVFLIEENAIAAIAACHEALVGGDNAFVRICTLPPVSQCSLLRCDPFLFAGGPLVLHWTLTTLAL
jgi:hypothetical protein